AALQGNTDTVRALLTTKAVDVNVASVSNRTPLFWPAVNGDSEVVQLLLEHGAKQDYVDVDGNSPLTVAQFYGETVIVRLLI
ncbi:ankyrin repeat protein, partial [Dendryphion nanum]